MAKTKLQVISLFVLGTPASMKVWMCTLYTVQPERQIRYYLRVKVEHADKKFGFGS